MADRRDLIRSLVIEDFDKSEEATRAIGPQGTQTLVAATFTLAANRKFQSGQDIREIADYVKILKDRYGERGSDIKPVVAGALIRGALGEHELLDGLPQDDVIPTEIALTFGIVKDLKLNGDELELFITEAEALAERWDS